MWRVLGGLKDAIWTQRAAASGAAKVTKGCGLISQTQHTIRRLLVSTSQLFRFLGPVGMMLLGTVTQVRRRHKSVYSCQGLCENSLITLQGQTGNLGRLASPKVKASYSGNYGAQSLSHSLKQPEEAHSCSTLVSTQCRRLLGPSFGNNFVIETS